RHRAIDRDALATQNDDVSNSKTCPVDSGCGGCSKVGDKRMAVTFQVLEGIDKGRVFRDLPTPLTIGREEGNILRLNDERVSRFHAKVQIDSEDFILTDL